MGITNTTIDGPPSGGVFESSGTPVRQAILDLADAIINATGSRWSKVTSSSPAPLQPYASTIDSGNTGNDNRGFGQHVTIFLDDDASLGTDNTARVVRFWRHQTGIIVSALDPIHKDTPTTVKNWVHGSQRQGQDFADRVPGDNFPSEGDITMINDDKQGNFDEDNDVQNLKQDTKYFFFLTDDFLWVNDWHLEKTTNFSDRGVGFYHPSVPGNGTISRSDHPFIWHMNPLVLREGTFNSNQNDLWSPASNQLGRDPDVSGEIRTFIDANSRDHQGREILSPVFVSKEQSTAWHFDSFIPEMRQTGNGTVFPNSDDNFPTRTVNGDEFMLAGGQSTGGSEYALKLTGNV